MTTTIAPFQTIENKFQERAICAYQISMSERLLQRTLKNQRKDGKAMIQRKAALIRQKKKTGRR